MSVIPAKHLPKSPFERWRTKLTALFFPFWLIGLISTRSEGFETVTYKVVEYVGFTAVGIAVIGRIWCSLYISGRKDHALCIVGPYSLSRNPLYFFSFVGVLGVCCAAQNLTLAVISGVIFTAYYHLIISKEEKRLSFMFGVDFDRYVRTVPRFFPRLAAPTINQKIEVNVRAFSRSLTEVFWFLVAFIVLEIIEDLRRNGFIESWVLSY